MLGFAVALALLHTNCIRNDLRRPEIQLARGVWGSMPPDPPSEPDHFKSGGYDPVMPLLVKLFTSMLGNIVIRGGWRWSCDCHMVMELYGFSPAHS